MVEYKKYILIGTFVKKTSILSFLEYVHNVLRIPYDRLYVYSIDGNSYEYFVTFNVRNKIDFKGKLANSTIIHTKNHCLFSINALNELIKLENGELDKEYFIDWSKFNGKLVLLADNMLKIESLNKIDDLCVFLKK